jgi:hypothetical protein
MTLTGKVTSIHTGSRFVDGSRRVTISISEDRGNNHGPLADITLRSDKLQLDEAVAVVITPVSGEDKSKPGVRWGDGQ